MSSDTLKALDTLQEATELSYGRVFELLMDGLRRGELGNIAIATRKGRGPDRTAIRVTFPYVKTLTVRKDIVSRLGEEARFKAYTARSYYAGAILQILLHRVGLSKLMSFVMDRPDIKEAIFYE